MIPGVRDLVTERHAFLATVTGLPADQFESGPTLCEGWAPRDVLAHLIGVDEVVGEYVTSGLRVNAVNARVVERWRARPAAELLDRARAWASSPSWTTRLCAWGLLGDLCIHHQDVLRGQGLSRDVPPYAGRAILREGLVLGGRKLTRYRIEPTDTGRALGRGRAVRGRAEALGMWLAGRRAVEPELEFGPIR